MSASLDDLFDQPRGSRLRDLIKFAQENRLEVGSTTGGRHNRGSKHPSGNAIDIRNSGNFSDEQVQQLSHAAADAGFKLRDERRRPPRQAVWGGPHLHVETDPQNLNDLFDSSSGQTPPVSQQRQPANPPSVPATKSKQSSVPKVLQNTNLLRQFAQQRAVQESLRQRAETTRAEVEKEYRGRRGMYGSPTPSGMLHLFANPIDSFTGLFRSDEENINRETQERLRQQRVAAEPEVQEIRREYGRMSAPTRTVVAPLARGGAGLLKTAGGIASAFGIAPNRLSEWANKRGEIIETGASMAPLAEERGLGSLITGQANLKEIERGVPEKIATGIADLGVGLGQIILLKRATGLRFNQVLALEAAAKNSDKSADTQLSRAAEAYALGTALDRHLSRSASAAIAGVPTAAQTGYEVSQDRMSPVDAAIQTGIQAGSGAILTTPKPKSQARSLPETFTQQRQARIETQGREMPQRLKDIRRRIDEPLDDLFDESQGKGQPTVEVQRATVESVVDREAAALRDYSTGSGEGHRSGYGGLYKEGRASIGNQMTGATKDFVEFHEQAHHIFKSKANESFNPAAMISRMRERPDVMVEFAETSTGKSHFKRQKDADNLFDKDPTTPNNYDWIEALPDLWAEYKLGRLDAQPKLKQWLEDLVPSAPKTETPQRFFHRDFGEVTESPNQRKVGKNRVRVIGEDGKEHIIKRSAMTGAGNQRAVPIKPEPSVGVGGAGEASPSASLPPEMRPTSEVARHNQEQLNSQRFRETLDLESVGGNAGENRAAVNMMIDSDGRIVAIGNIQDLPDITQTAYRAGRLKLATATVRSDLSLETPQIEQIVIRGSGKGKPAEVSSKWFVDFEDPSRSTGSVPPEMMDLAVARKARQDVGEVGNAPPSPAFPAIPERSETLDTQMQALTAGTRDAVLVPRGEPKPKTPRGIVEVATEQGSFYVNPRKVSSRQVIQKVKDGTAHELLGIVEPKSEKTTATVAARTPEGIEAQAVAVSPERAPEQVAKLQQQYPEAKIETGGPELAERILTERVQSRSTSSIKNEATTDLRHDLELLEIERPEKKSFQRSIDNAIARGYDKQAEQIADEIIAGGREIGLDNERAAGLLIRIRELENQWEAAYRQDPKSPEVARIKAQLDKLSEATDIGGTAPARDLAFRRSMIDKDFRLISLIRQAEKAKGRQVAPEEVARYEQVIKERDTAIAERDAALEKAYKAQLQKEINTTSRQQKRTETKQQIDAEWTQLKDQLAQIRESRTGAFFKSEKGELDPEVAKIALKMLRNRVQAGVTKAEDVIDEIHRAVGGARRDVIESLALGNERTRQQSELTRNLAQVRREITKLRNEEDIAAGRRSTRQEGPKRDLQRNQQRLKQLEAREAEYQRRIDEGDFAPRVREPYPYGPEVRAAERRVENAEAKFYKEMERAKGGHQLRNLSGIYKAWLLSGPITHVKNIGGTGMYQVFSEGARVPAVIMDAAISTGRQALGLPAQRGISGPSPSAMIQSAAHAAKVGGREALDILRQGATKEQMERHQFQEIDFGVNTGKPAVDRGVKIIELAHNAIFRFMAASDRVFYQHAYKRNLIDRASVQARNEGLTGKERADRARELINNPPEQLDADAKHDALVATFNNNNALSTKIKAARAVTLEHPRLSRKAAERINAAENLALDFVLPFDRTPTNVVMRILEASPAGYIKNAAQLVRSAINKSMTAEDQRQFSQTFGRATAGTALIALGWKLADELFDVDERGVVTLKIGGGIRLDFVSPIGNLIATGVRLRKVHDEEAKKAPNKQQKLIKDIKIAGREAANIPLLGATSRVSELITDPDRSAARIGSRMAYGLTPFSGLTRQVGEFLDPEEREAKTFKEQFQRNVPILRERLPERKKKSKRFSGYK